MNKLFNDSSAFTLATFLDILTTLSIAFLAVSIPFDLDILHASDINIVECNFNFDKFWFGLFGTSLSLSTVEEIAKNITESTTSSGWASILDTFLSIFIIQLSFLWVGEGLICVGNSLEFIGVTSFIGVFLESLSPEGLSDLLGGGFLINTEELIVGGGIDLFLLLGLLLLAGHSAAEAAESSEAWESS